MERSEPPFTDTGKEYKTVQLLGGTEYRHSKSAPRDPPESRTGLQANAGTQLFTEALVPKVKRQKQASCPSPDEWVEQNMHSL